MKKIEAIIRPYQLPEVKKALAAIDILGMTVIEAKGLGRQKGHSENYRGVEFYIDFVPNIKIEILLTDDKVATCVETIMQSARTGNIGDGKIIVSTVDEVYRIRTGERAEEAL